MDTGETNISHILALKKDANQMGKYKRTIKEVLNQVPNNWAKGLTGVSNLQSAGRMRLRMATNAAQHKIVNLLKTL